MKKNMHSVAAVITVIAMAMGMNPIIVNAVSDEIYCESEIINDIDLPGNDELFEMYAYSQLYDYSDVVSYNLLYGDGTVGSMNNVQKKIYNNLKTSIKQIADGNLNSSEIIFTLSLNESEYSSLKSLGQSFSRNIISGLLNDAPYELYWYDKTKGCSSSYTGSKSDATYTIDFTYKFYVSADYSQTGNTGTTNLNTTKTKAASTAAANAVSVVSANANKSDREKLIAYKEYICNAVKYNNDAANNPLTAYGDPWQMISVFDDNPDTDVVCEGYSKAFQYLCDLSTFSDNTECWVVTGIMSSSTGSGPHMWNTVRMNDGLNYIVDVTNSDSGTIGQNGELFLQRATSGSVSEGYNFQIDSSNIITYTYNSSVIDDFGEKYLSLFGTAVTENSSSAPSFPEGTGEFGFGSGTGNVEDIVDKNVFNVILPTAPETDSLDFILDPQKLITATNGAKFPNGTQFESDATLFFANSGSNVSYSSTSDEFTAYNLSSADVEISVKGKISNADGITFTKNTPVDNTAQVQLAIVGPDESAYFEQSDDGITAELIGTINAVAGDDSFKVVYNDTTNSYSYTLDSSITTSSDKISKFTFKLSGSAAYDSLGKAWFNIADIQPKIDLVWEINSPF